MLIKVRVTLDVVAPPPPPPPPEPKTPPPPPEPKPLPLGRSMACCSAFCTIRSTHPRRPSAPRENIYSNKRKN